MTQVDPNIEKFIQENYPLMEAGDYDEVYDLAVSYGDFMVSELTQTLWNCDIHPEKEGLTEIPFKFAACLDIRTFRVPQGIQSIGSLAFHQCYSLTKIDIPDSVTIIEGYAFNGCSSLTSIVIPDSVTYIGSQAFCGCSSLTSVTIPDGVTDIKTETFYGCSALTSVTIPDSVISIKDAAFSGCDSLKEIIYNGTKEQWQAIKKEAAWVGVVEDLLVHCTDGELYE